MSHCLEVEGVPDPTTRQSKPGPSGPPGKIIRAQLQDDAAPLQWYAADDPLDADLDDYRLDDQFVGVEALMLDCQLTGGDWVSAEHIVIKSSGHCLNIKLTSGSALDWTLQDRAGDECSGPLTTLKKVGEIDTGNVPPQLALAAESITAHPTGSSCKAVRLRTQLPP